MPLKRLSLTVGDDLAGQRLDRVLTAWLPVALKAPVSKAKARKLIVAGAVYLNGRRIRIASKPVFKGSRLEAHVDPAKLLSDEPAREKQAPFVMDASRILFEDEWLIAVDKPAGLPTQPTLDEARTNLYAALGKFLSARDQIPQAYVGLHHRLDRDTSGVILFTKKKEANAGIAEQFSAHKARKTYVALTVAAELPPFVENFLGKLPGEGKKARFGAVRSGGDPARTEIAILEKLRAAMLVEARPLTGRTHQIRVHLSEAGAPILGDPWYGGPIEVGGTRVPRVMLHAAALTFTHPVTNLEISVRAPFSEDFKTCLTQLGSGRAS